MGIFSKRKAEGSDRGRSAGAHLERVDPSLPDAQWFAVSQDIYDRAWRRHLGSPETFADAGSEHYGNQNFGVAMLFFCKAIDLLHTLYLSSGMSTRQPAARDLAITSGFISSLGASLSLHPAAPAADSVREVTHRLRTISSVCKRAGVPAELYLNALREIAIAAPT